METPERKRLRDVGRHGRGGLLPRRGHRFYASGVFKKCDQCDNEATVHEVSLRHGVKIEKHLCEGCAASQGIAATPSAPINELIKHYVLSHGITPMPATGKANVCPRCHTGFNEFRQHGLLGCPDCYRVFEAQLGPLIERAHDGGVKHMGKSPRRMLGHSTRQAGELAGPPTPESGEARRIVDLEERAERLRRIRKKLASAVAAEKYEEAARLRDELKKMSEQGAPPPKT